ncbi:putative metal-dependent phosphoesterase TrpH [Anaerosolibacter carboniphilus]|uniref:Putative metal-dependent phosphoesterase TrpH n=1 Tax=Anaerosolibacter carboniphilus TaxID=1417629 RepID=A0A841L3S4_9FIRM|nr:CehA/McbA family metallohydrolase [Anaerosolibacter carboniphilus]MBB6218820.1 putative metal-dependent phosphoesterase TrpH [Anaerosolibacter carboniphilus]
MMGMLDGAREEPDRSVFDFQGVFSPRDGKKYFQFPFQVQNGASKIVVKVEYDKTSENVLYLQLYDYRNFRGIGKSSDNGQKKQLSIIITPTHASPGAIFGNLPRGRWVAEIDADEIPMTCKYNLTIEVYYHTKVNTRFAIKKPKYKERILIPEENWYKGDLHIHSIESDGREQVREIIQEARDVGLDFIAITDHNTISPWQYFKRYKDILLIPGVELSTHDGHANAIGLEDWVDWRLGYRNRTIQHVIQDTHDQGALFSINHPGIRNEKGEESFRIKNIDIATIDCIEIWNGPWTKHQVQANKRARDLWTQWLNEGYRITAIAGSDLHSLKTYGVHLGKLINHVYSKNLSQLALLEAIKGGRVFLSMGPKVYFTANDGMDCYMIGDIIKTNKNRKITFSIHAVNVDSRMEIRVIKDGQVLECYESQGKEPVALCFQEEVSQKAWYRIEIHDKSAKDTMDSLLAITNPIYIEE